MAETAQAVEKIPHVVRGRVELIVPIENGDNTYIPPAFGPQTYQEVGKQILKTGLYVPTGSYTAPLVHAAYCSKAKNEPEFKDVREIMKSRWLWVFQRNLWTDQGLYSINDAEAKGRSEPMTINQLEKMLKGGREVNGIRFSTDNSVRFAPKGSYTLGEHTPESLTKDGAVIAQYGVRGAELLGEVSATFKNNPCTYGLDIKEGNVPELRVSTLYGSVGGLRLDDCFDYGDDGFAFPVSAPFAKNFRI